MKQELTGKSKELKIADCFAKGTWTALGLAVVLLSIDAYAVFYIPRHRWVAEGEIHHGLSLFRAGLGTVEIGLALLAVWLIRFAFTRVSKQMVRLS